MNEQNYLPRVAAIHDICGFGKCSLATALPVISACGAEVSPIPTRNFFSKYTFSRIQVY